ncbi:MAG: DNA polymerase IV [Phycisphaerales bacterium JB039]
MTSPRWILHVDMDAFFAAVEQLDNPELRGKPVLVGGTGPRGVVATASYEARPFGCHSAQPMSVARRLCPQAIVVRGNHARYRELSDQVFAILQSFTPLVQPISVDEAFMDVTGSIRLHGPADQIARKIRARIRAETGLTASVGVAQNKFLAKLASDLHKPDGLTVIRPEDVRRILDPLPVGRMWGVGPAAEKRLTRLGARTFADLRRMPRETLASALGSWGARIWELSQGIDEREVHLREPMKSVSHESTFGENIASRDEARAVIADHAGRVAARLRAKGLVGRTVTVKIRFGNFETITRSDTLDSPTDRTDEIAPAAGALFDAWPFRPVRLLGVGVSHLAEGGGEQLGLFDSEQRAKQRAADAAADAVARKFGKGAIRRGSAL